VAAAGAFGLAVVQQIIIKQVGQIHSSELRAALSGLPSAVPFAGLLVPFLFARKGSLKELTATRPAKLQRIRQGSAARFPRPSARPVHRGRARDTPSRRRVPDRLAHRRGRDGAALHQPQPAGGAVPPGLAGAFDLRRVRRHHPGSPAQGGRAPTSSPSRWPGCSSCRSGRSSPSRPSGSPGSTWRWPRSPSPCCPRTCCTPPASPSGSSSW